MNDEIMQLILDKIKEFETIIISRHTRPDGDAIGSTMGLFKILKLTYPNKHIFLDNEDYSEYVSFLGDEGPHPTDEDYKKALVIVIDTGTANRISNKRYGNGKLLIKIDHHIIDNPYGDIVWVEEERSSACEMITWFYMNFKNELKIDKTAAECLYTGMVTDSGRFRFKGTNSDTLICASELLKHEVDMEQIYARLYMDELSILKFHSTMINKIKITENGVAWIYISAKTREKYNLSQEEASNIVSIMDSIKGSLIWLAFIDNDDGSIRVRLRSRFLGVQKLARKYNGGGHENASGATVYSRKERNNLISDADKLLKEFKECNENWI